MIRRGLARGEATHSFVRASLKVAATLRLVEGSRPLGVAMVVKHMVDLGGGYAGEREWRDVVFGEEVYGRGFDA